MIFFYNKIGKAFCIALDVALNMGGSEAIVEGFYSVMKTQQNGNQSNEILSQRTVVDWIFPPTTNCPENDIREVAKLYLDGNKEFGLTKHLLPMFFDSKGRQNSFTTGAGKVMDRMSKATYSPLLGRLPDP